jgi:hypothetical protein
MNNFPLLDTFLWTIAEMPEPKIVAYDLSGLIGGLKL